MLIYQIVHENKRMEIQTGEFLIGRNANCQLILDDSSVSRTHAAIINSAGIFRIEDRESRNGVVVNGKRIDGATNLENGDQIAIGHQRMQVEIIETRKDSDRTVGLQTCHVCGSFADTNEAFCPNCGANIGKVPTTPPRDVSDVKESRRRTTAKESIVIEQQPMAAMAGLALKAMQVGKPEEAKWLVAGALKSALEKIKRKNEITDEEILTVSKALILYAEATKSSETISSLFEMHLEASRLMTREIVDTLYDAVQKADYLACSKMGSYLRFLETVEESFSPGEKFVHRRLQGLVKICS